MTGMDAEFAKWLATLGVGGVLAGLMFMFYRKDIKQYTELWKTSSDQMIDIVKENTTSNTRLISLLEAQERNALRKSDIDNLVTQRISEHVLVCPVREGEKRTEFVDRRGNRER